MTMTEGMVPDDAIRLRDGRLTVAVHLPWYRSLPLSCLESVAAAIDGTDVGVDKVAVPGFAGTVKGVATTDVWWDLRDALVVTLDRAACPGDVVRLSISVAVRIPYLQTAPGVPLLQRATVEKEATAS